MIYPVRRCVQSPSSPYSYGQKLGGLLFVTVVIGVKVNPFNNMEVPQRTPRPSTSPPGPLTHQELWNTLHGPYPLSLSSSFCWESEGPTYTTTITTTVTGYIRSGFLGSTVYVHAWPLPEPCPTHPNRSLGSLFMYPRSSRPTLPYLGLVEVSQPSLIIRTSSPSPSLKDFPVTPKSLSYTNRVVLSMGDQGFTTTSPFDWMMGLFVLWFLFISRNSRYSPFYVSSSYFYSTKSPGFSSPFSSSSVILYPEGGGTTGRKDKKDRGVYVS